MMEATRSNQHSQIRKPTPQKLENAKAKLMLRRQELREMLDDDPCGEVHNREVLESCLRAIDKEGTNRVLSPAECVAVKMEIQRRLRSYEKAREILADGLCDLLNKYAGYRDMLRRIEHPAGVPLLIDPDTLMSDIAFFCESGDMLPEDAQIYADMLQEEGRT